MSMALSSEDEGNPLSDLPMNGFQRAIVAITFILMCLDGFDVLAASFAVPGIGQDWGLDRTQLGVILSAGLLGMAAGSLGSGAIADMIGRRPAILLNLLIMTIGMGATAFAQSYGQVVLLRVITGLGIGGMVVALNPMAAEFSNRQWRNFAVGLMAIGFPIGGMIGGVASAVLLEDYGWRAIFIAGGVFSLALFPLIYLLLPESIALLSAGRRVDRLQRINAILARCGHAAIERLPPSIVQRKVGYAALLAPDLRLGTVLMTAAFFLFFVTDFYFLGWIPQLVVDRGFSQSTASSIGAWCNIGGVAGGLALGWISRFADYRKLGLIACFGTTLTVVLFAWLPAGETMLGFLAALVGFFLFGTIVTLYGAVTRVFPARCRGSGAGLAIGVGRLGAIVAPVLSGHLFALGLSGVAVSALLGLGAVAAGFCFLALPDAAEHPSKGATGSRSLQTAAEV